jgi:hypothetical protein
MKTIFDQFSFTLIMNPPYHLRKYVATKQKIAKQNQKCPNDYNRKTTKEQAYLLDN